MTDKYDSTDDQRTSVGNETRQQYRKLSQAEQETMAFWKDTGQMLIDSWKLQRQNCNDPDKARCYSIAITKMEEAVMWSVKGLTK